MSKTFNNTQVPKKPDRDLVGKPARQGEGHTTRPMLPAKKPVPGRKPATYTTRRDIR